MTAACKRARPAVLAAELVAHYFPKLVELHNYSSANSLRQKLYNWATLNRKKDANRLLRSGPRKSPHYTPEKVFRRLNFDVKKAEIEAIVNCKPGCHRGDSHAASTQGV